MKNLVGVRVADATEQMRIGQRALDRVISALKRFGKRRKIRVHHFEATRIVLSKHSLTLYEVQRRLPLGTRFSENQRSVLKIEGKQADFAGDGSAGRLPSKASRDHQMENQKQFAVGLNDHAFAQPAQGDHPAAFNGG